MWAADESGYASPVEVAVINWERIEKFVGFRRSDAPVVFIGMAPLYVHSGPGTYRYLWQQCAYRPT